MDSHQKGPKKPVIFGFEISSIEKLSTKKLKCGLPSVTFFSSVVLSSSEGFRIISLSCGHLF